MKGHAVRLLASVPMPYVGDPDCKPAFLQGFSARTPEKNVSPANLLVQTRLSCCKKAFTDRLPRPSEPGVHPLEELAEMVHGQSGQLIEILLPSSVSRACLLALQQHTEFLLKMSCKGGVGI